MNLFGEEAMWFQEQAEAEERKRLRKVLRPYYEDSHATLYHGDCREILPALDYVNFILTDPPYGGTEQMKGYGRMQNYNGNEGRKIFGDQNLDVVREVAPLCWLAIGEPGWLVTFCAPRKILEVGDIFAAQGF